LADDEEAAPERLAALVAVTLCPSGDEEELGDLMVALEPRL
jgi:hypothetical protein